MGQVKLVTVGGQLDEEIRIVRIFRGGKAAKAKSYSAADDGTKVRREIFLTLVSGKIWRDRLGNEYHAKFA